MILESLSAVIHCIPSKGDQSTEPLHAFTHSTKFARASTMYRAPCWVSCPRERSLLGLAEVTLLG